MKRLSYWLVPLASWLAPAAVLAQERFYEWHWKMHPMWWGWGLAMMAMMFLFWALVIVGLIVGIRWLLGKGERKNLMPLCKYCGSVTHAERSTRKSSRPGKEICWHEFWQIA